MSKLREENDCWGLRKNKQSVSSNAIGWCNVRLGWFVKGETKHNKNMQPFHLLRLPPMVLSV